MCVVEDVEGGCCVEGGDVVALVMLGWMLCWGGCCGNVILRGYYTVTLNIYQAEISIVMNLFKVIVEVLIECY